MRLPEPDNDNEPLERSRVLIEAHIAYAEGRGAVIDNLAFSTGDEYICSKTSQGCLTSEYKEGGNSDEIVHTME